jgi:hypothetical protein
VLPRKKGALFLVVGQLLYFYFLMFIYYDDNIFEFIKFIKLQSQLVTLRYRAAEKVKYVF